ncbi:MAG: NAD(P)/FAD-dependent oxidoreductase [Dichotomicrobium sp.]
MAREAERRARVVIVGAGFGGLEAAKRLADQPVDVTVIDKRNYHLFQPLLYQVATADLSPADVAWPIRGIFSRYANIRVIMARVTDIDLESRRVFTSKLPVDYDYLVIASGSHHSYFGNDHWAPHAPGLKRIIDATEIRKRILLAFERAEITESEEERQRQLTFVIVGGGPTGVEMAGAIAELARYALAADFRRINPRLARVILAEAGDRLLTAFPEDLSDYAKRALEKLGVEVRLNSFVEVEADRGALIGDTLIPSATIIWGAGVTVPYVMDWLKVETDGTGRVPVAPDLSVPGRPEVFVVGDAALVAWKPGVPVPGIAPAAKQEGRYVGDLLRAEVKGRRKPEPFRYRHNGNLATIGRHAAIADFGRFRLTGAIAWWLWGVAHIYFLIGVRAPLLVAIQWFWAYLTFGKGARLITGASTLSEPGHRHGETAEKTSRQTADLPGP